MSQEDVEVMRRSFDAWNEGDTEAIHGVYAEDVPIETAISELGRTLGDDDPVGHWVAETRETGAEVHWDIERIFEGQGWP
jgi:hypothetical protein